MLAVFVSVTTLTLTAAPTPTPWPDDWPDWPPDSLFALPTAPPADWSPVGSRLSLPDVLGVFWTLSFAWPSELPPVPGVVPCALAVTSALPDVVVVAASTTDVPEMLRTSAAVVVTVSTLTAMMAPTATLLLAAFASPVMDADPVWVARRRTAPVAAMVPAPGVPMRASVVLTTMLMPTAGLTATLEPAEPAVTVFTTGSAEVAVSVTLRPPVSDAPSMTSARVTLVVSTLIATEAPTPTVPPPPIDASASAFAESDRRF